MAGVSGVAVWRETLAAGRLVEVVRTLHVKRSVGRRRAGGDWAAASAAGIVQRRLRLTSGSIVIPSRADQPGRELDPDLRLLIRALGWRPEGPVVEVAAWDAGLALAAASAGWDAAGALAPLTLGAAHSCAAGAGRWRVQPPPELPPAAAACAVVRAPYWLGRAGVEWTIRRAARALRLGGRLALLGGRGSGVDSLPSRAEAIVGPLIERGAGHHRRLYVFERRIAAPPAQTFGWTSTARLDGRPLTLHHHPTLFSADRVDPASELLAASLPDRGGAWLDLGCGNGVLAAAAARADRSLTAVDWSFAAVETTRRTLAANGVEARAALADAVPPDLGPMDVVLCYPPLHVGPRVRHGPAARLMAAARDCLAPDGELRVVLTGAQSPAALLSPHFRRTALAAERGRHRVFACQQPMRPSA